MVPGGIRHITNFSKLQSIKILGTINGHHSFYVGQLISDPFLLFVANLDPIPIPILFLSTLSDPDPYCFYI